MQQSEPVHTFKTTGTALSKIDNSLPGPNTPLQRIIVRAPCLSTHRYRLGLWNRARALITQYNWLDDRLDDNSLLNSSTSQLKILQARALTSEHGTLNKWVTQLGRPISEAIWHEMWILYRSAAENTFMYQLIYRIPATNKWHLSDRPATDADTWCPWCNLHLFEDTLHCLWDCSTS